MLDTGQLTSIRVVPGSDAWANPFASAPRGPSLGRPGRDVLVEAEEVFRVVLPLDVRQPRVGLPRIRLVDACGALVLQEVDVNAGAFVADGLPERPGPRLMN